MNYFRSLYNRLPNRPRFFTRRYWRPDRKGYNELPSVISTIHDKPAVYETNFQNLQINPEYSAQQNNIPEDIINILYSFYRRESTNPKPRNQFISSIKQQYTCNGIKYDFVVPADINTNNRNRDDRYTYYFWAINKGLNLLPKKISNCIFINNRQGLNFGGYKNITLKRYNKNRIHKKYTLKKFRKNKIHKNISHKRYIKKKIRKNI